MWFIRYSLTVYISHPRIRSVVYAVIQSRLYSLRTHAYRLARRQFLNVISQGYTGKATGDVGQRFYGAEQSVKFI
jgi:hypothetical protein